MTISNFIRQKSYEKIVFMLRRHYITFVPTIVLFIFLFLAPLAVYFLTTNLVTNFLSGETAWPITVILSSIYYLSVILFFFSFFITFYLDLTIVTNDRLVDIEQTSLFGRTVAEVDLSEIQDATSEIRGFFPSLFKYGNLTIQTAGAVPKFFIKNIPNPDFVRQRILDLAADDKKFHNG